MKDWFIPSIGFSLFVYFMLFVVLYAIKIGGPNVPFYTEENYDETKAFSNTFKKEYPKGSGIIKEFPEMDKYAWMNIKEAKEKIIKGQIYFINKLDNILKGEK